jgi:HSP20 family protein
MSENKVIMKKENAPVEPAHQLRSIVPEVDILENEEEILLNVDLPGVTRENLTIQIDNGKMTLTGIRRLNVEGAATWEEFTDVEYHRVFSVPQSIDVNNVNAELRDGVLHLHLEKTPAAKPKRIEIKTS